MAPRSKKENLKIQEQTREKILMAALQAFGERGYASTSVSYIAKEAGISKGLIYHYFDSKEDVLKGIFGMMVHEGEVIMSHWENNTPQEKLRQTIIELVEFIKNKPTIMRFMMSLSLQPAAIADLEEVMEAEKSRMMAQYQKIFEELGYDDPEQEAYYTGAALDGIALGFMSVKDYPIHKMEQKILKHYKL